MATEVKKVYTLDIQGVDSVNDLRSAIEQLTEKLKQLNQESKEYKDTLKELTDLQTKLAAAMNGIGDSTQKAADSLKTVKETATDATQNIKDMGDASQKAKENLENMGEANTIKELRAEIKTLKEELSNLEIGSTKYKEVATQLANEEKRLKDTMTEVKTSVQNAEGSYNDLSIKMRQLKEEYHATNDEARRNELAPQIAEIQQKLKDMDAAVLVFTRNVGNYKSALEGLDSEFVSQKRELKDLKLAMEQLDPASEAYAEAFQRAAEITHNLSEQQEALKYASTDLGDQLGNIRGIASNLAAGYTAVNAAMGLFGEENENVKEALLKVQQTMALVQGLQGLDGFIKRTQGLSTAMKAWIKTSRESAAATRADAAASAADAAAKGAEATATAGAVAPQLALNAAMKANPIGFIIGLLATLVTLFALFKDKIMELIGGNEKMKESFDKVKAVLAGFGTIIKKSVINPIKMALIPLKTLGKVMVDVFNGDWSKIGDDFKAGMEEMKETAIDTINVVGAFKEVYEAKQKEIEEQRARERAEARSKELDDQIKDLEAKYGADKKYTEEGKKLYMEYFDAKIAMYDKDSDEYKQAVRDKWEYEREFAEKQKQAAEKAAAAEAAAAKKSADAAKQAYEKRLSDFKSAFSKYLPSGVTVEMNFKEMQTKWNKGLKDFKAWFKKQYKDLFNDVNFDDMWNKVVADYVKGLSDITRVEAENIVKLNQDQENNLLNAHKLRIELKEIQEGLVLPDDYINDWELTYNVIDKTIKQSIEAVQKAQTQIEKTYGEVFSYIDDLSKRGQVINEALLKDSSYQALLAKEEELQNKRSQLVLDDLNLRSDVAKKVYDKEVETLDKTYSSQERYYQKLTDLRKSQLSLYGDRTEESLEAKQENVMYELRVVNLNKLADAYRKMANDTKLSAEERKNAELELKNTLAQIEDAEVEHTIATNQRRKESWKNTIDYISTASQGLSTMFGNISTAYEDYINQEVAAGKMSEEEAKRRFETVKGVQKAQTLVNTFASAISAFQSMASIPYVGPVLGAAAAAAAIAAGMVQIANIDSTTWQGNSNGGGNASSTAAYQLPNVLIPEPQYTQNLTNQDDTDRLANAIGNAVGGQRVFVVESDIDAAQKHSRKVSIETTF